MSERALKRILVALAAALLVYSSLAIVSRVRSGASVGSGGFARALEAVDTATLSTIALVSFSDSVLLERAGERWTVNGYRPDATAVARLLTAIATSEVGDVAATNPQNHLRLGVDGPEAWTVRMTDLEGRRTEIILGKTGIRFGSAFARLPDQETVITLTGDLRPSVVKTLDQWRDKNVAAVDTARVAEIAVGAEGQYRLQRAGDTWNLGGAPADSFTVANLLGELADIDAIGFLPAGSEPAGDERSLTAVTAEGDTLVRLLGWVGEGSFHVQVLDAPEPERTVFELSDWRADRLMPPADSLRPR